MRYRLKGTGDLTPDVPALGHVIQEVKRELAIRGTFYERRVADGKMGRSQAQQQYRRLDAARELLEWFYDRLEIDQAADPQIDIGSCAHSLTQLHHYLGLRSDVFCAELKRRYPDVQAERARLCRFCRPVFDLICDDQVRDHFGVIPNSYYEEHYKRIKKAVVRLSKELVREKQAAAAAMQRRLL